MPDQTIDFVVIFLTVGMLVLWLGSVALGWIVKTYDRVMSRFPTQTDQTVQTDTQTDYVSVADQWLDRLEVDRTKTALIELLVYSDWDVGQIRRVLKGDNGVLGTEIEDARKRLGMDGDLRQLRVRDDHGERLIPMDA